MADWYSGTALCTAAYSVAVWYSGTALLQLTVSHFGIAGPLSCNLQCGNLLYRDCFTTAYIVAVWYSGTALLQLTMRQFGIAGPLYVL